MKLLFSLCSFLFTVAVNEAADPFNRYAGYLPTTKITDEAAIDLDQHDFNEQLSERRFVVGYKVYTQGGHSGSYATLTIPKGSATGSFAAGTAVLGITQYNDTVEGHLMEDVELVASAPTAIKVIYLVGHEQATYVDCQVGGLVEMKLANKDGCFAEQGKIKLIPTDVLPAVFDYSYDVRKENKNTRTLQLLSTEAANTMKMPDGSYMPEFQVYVDYYGDTNYGDKWVTAAANGTNTAFASGLGDSDFSLYTARPTKSEAMRKGSTYLNIWMEVVRQLNDAVNFCKSDKLADAEHSIDKAVAFYTGSQVVLLDDKEGILLYALAQVRARQQKTAGHMDNKDEGDAYVNVQIMSEFKNIQSFVSKNNTNCESANQAKDKIVMWMKIPLIQGVLHYGYMLEKEIPEEAENHERMQAEGATFAATVLPWLHACDSRVAKVIHDNLKMGSTTKFGLVRSSLERCYEQMKIDCTNVGGVWDHDKNQYKPGAYPCGVSEPSSAPAGHFIGSFVGIGVGVLLAGWLCMRYRKKLSFGNKKLFKEDQPPKYSDSGNIAAVTEIA